MRHKWIIAVALILPAALSAQDLGDRRVRTERITGAPAGGGLYAVTADGTVLIDWRAVDSAANGLGDRMATPVARMMLAIRDGNWKPLQRL